MENNPSITPVQPETPKFPQRQSRLVRNLRTLPLAALLLITNPSPIDAAASQNNVVVEANNPVNQKKEEMQKRYNIVLDGDWGIDQLNVLDNSLGNLPDSLVQAHPGKLTHFSIEQSDYIDAGCTCRSSVQRTPFDINSINISVTSETLRDQEITNRLITHEIIHSASQIYEYFIGDSPNVKLSLWYQDEFERAVGMSSKDFSDYILVNIQNNYSSEYEFVKNSIGSIDTYELMKSEKYFDLLRVSRLMYGAGELATPDPSKKEYPTEMISVLGEFYIQGNDNFMRNTQGILTQEQSEKTYNLLKIYFFKGREYNSDGSFIKNSNNLSRNRGNLKDITKGKQ